MKWMAFMQSPFHGSLLLTMAVIYSNLCFFLAHPCLFSDSLHFTWLFHMHCSWPIIMSVTNCFAKLISRLLSCPCAKLIKHCANKTYQRVKV
jgi:hypothetical protein